MTIYFPNGNYGPICDIIPEVTPEPIVTVIEIEDPTERASPDDKVPTVLKKAAKCRTVRTIQRYSPNGPYGPICDIESGGDGDGGNGSYYDCPDEPTDVPTRTIYKPEQDLLDAIGDPGNNGGLVCIELDDGSEFCYDPNIHNGCAGTDFNDIIDDLKVLSDRCAGFRSIADTTVLPNQFIAPTLICGSIQRYSSHGIYEHTTPTGITYMNVILIGAGGGAGGGDGQRNKSNGNVTASGRGNNSGGCGSIVRLTLTLNPNKANKITAIVGEGGKGGIHFSNTRKRLRNSFNGGAPGGIPGPDGKSGGGGGGGGASSLYVNGQLVAHVAGGGGGGGSGCNAFVDDPSKYIKNILCFATGGKGGFDNVPVGVPGRVHVGVGRRGGIGADDDPNTGKYGGGAGGRFTNGDRRNAATQSGKGGGGGHGVDLDGNRLTNGATTSTASGGAGGDYGGGGGGNAPGGSGGAGGKGAVRIKYGATTLTYTTPGTYTHTVPGGVTKLDEIVCISGGGSGHKDTNGDDEGGGGGGGAYAYDNNVPVTPGATLTIKVGAGGATRTTQGSNNGGHSYVISSNDADGYDPAPWGNWQNHRIEGTPTNPVTYEDNTDNVHYGLLVQEFPKFTNPPLLPVQDGHELWSYYMRRNAAWVNDGEPNYNGSIRDIRLNLQFTSSGTHSMDIMVDDIVAVYIAPWYEIEETAYIDGGRLYNGEPTAVNGINIEELSSWPSTIDADISGAANWTRIAVQDFNANDNTPATKTFNISSPGRYVLRFLLYNDYAGGGEWKSNPAGLALSIFRPDGKKIWDTRGFNGNWGSPLWEYDGGGGGGGGGYRGRGGVNAFDLGYASGSCDFADSTACGGSAGKTYILQSPGVEITYFNQAPGGHINGYQRPGTGDASYRHGTGGYGGSRPTNFSIIFNGNEYPLYNSSGSYYDVLIPGMGNGVWTDFASGKEFPYHYFWGESGSNPTNATALQRLSRGTYEGAVNNTINRTGFYKPKSLELALWWNPVKAGNSWNTYVRLRGIPKWGLGAGWAVNDTVTGRFPPSKDDGTQPWLDTTVRDSWWQNGVRTQFWMGENMTIPGTSFSFQIKVTEVTDNIPGTKGDAGHIRYQYGYSLAASTPGLVSGDLTTGTTSIPNTYPSPNEDADDPTSDDNTGT